MTAGRPGDDALVTSDLERHVARVLDQLSGETTGGHVEAFDEVHRVLREALADAGSTQD